jgi:hypothetical protein
MDDKQIREHLEELRGEIDKVESTDEKAQDLLRDLGADIRELLEHSTKSGKLQPGPLTLPRMEQAIESLESDHPTLTQLLSQLLETLSNAGI